jgi:hypothetical protein
MRPARIDAHFARYVEDGRLHPIRPQLKQPVYQALVD